MSWSYVVESLSGTAVGEVMNASERKATLGINRPSTASFSIRPDNALLTKLYEDDMLLKVYENNTLRFRGNIVSVELATQEDGSAPNVKVNAIDPAWKLSKRLLGLSSGGTTYTGDKAKAARKMINELNTDTVTYPTNPHTGIKLLGEGEYAAGGEGTYVAGPYKSALSCINDLAHGFDGFDWRMEPIEGETATVGGFTVPLLATFKAAATIGGTSKAVFEHGFGQKNVRKLSFLRDLAGLANKAFHLPDEGFTETSEVKSASDGTSLEHRGRFEDIADGFGLTDATLRTKWVEEFVRVRKNPRFVVGMTLDMNDGTSRVPQYGTDYVLGDMVTARSMINESTLLFDGLVRVYQVQIEVNDNGTGIVTPILIDEEGTQL